MKILLYGFLVGIISPLVGVFLYSQISTSVGDIFLMPLYILSSIFDESFWYLTLQKQLLLFVLCGVFYSSFIGYLEIASREFEQQ